MSIMAPTIVSRSTVAESFREILSEDSSLERVKFTTPAGLDVFKMVIRKVQILVPMNPPTYLIVTPDPRFIDRETKQPIRNMAHAAGFDRTYKGTLLTPGAQIVFHLFPEQGLWAGCGENYAELGIICEYLEPNL